ncbi:ATRAID (predicted) [Pycnogonum litorale]
MLLFLSSRCILIANSSPNICKFCDSSSTKDGYIKHFCASLHYATMDHRCCLNSTEIVGLDLSNCKIANLDGLITNLTSLVALDLRDNDNLKNTSSVFFNHLTELDELYLPPNVGCPGGIQAWNETNNSTYCHSQLNPCHYFNITCLKHGMCNHNGPGLARCSCKPGFSGYKCLVEGEFPWATYFISLTCSTIVLSAVLWCTQRRKVIKVS